MTSFFIWTSVLWPLAGIHLDSTVFVAIRGDEWNITCDLRIPANESSSMFTCTDPFQKQIFNSVIPATTDGPKNYARKVPLKRMQSSGEYSCKYKAAKVFWFLRLRGERGKHRACSISHWALAQVLIAALFVFFLFQIKATRSSQSQISQNAS